MTTSKSAIGNKTVGYAPFRQIGTEGLSFLEFSGFQLLFLYKLYSIKNINSIIVEGLS